MAALEFSDVALPHLDAAYNLARWLVRDATLAEDVVQDAFVRALTYFATYRGDGARAWLLRIVRTTAYSRLSERSGRLNRETALDESALEQPDPGWGPESALIRSDAIERGLAALPTELRECLVLRELEELSYAEIARVTEVPLGTVMSRLWRARAALARTGAEVAR